MNTESNCQPDFRRRAKRMLEVLRPEQREALLVKCWMSHDAYWYRATAATHGFASVNRINQQAAYDVGCAEARRVIRALQLPPMRTLEDCIQAQEIIIELMGPELIDYEVSAAGENAYRVQVHRCFAHENVTRAGILDQYECGIFSRIRGWLSALGVDAEVTPPLGGCLKRGGGDCVYTLTLRSYPEGATPESGQPPGRGERLGTGG